MLKGLFLPVTIEIETECLKTEKGYSGSAQLL